MTLRELPESLVFSPVYGAKGNVPERSATSKLARRANPLRVPEALSGRSKSRQDRRATPYHSSRAARGRRGRRDGRERLRRPRNGRSALAVQSGFLRPRLAENEGPGRHCSLLCSGRSFTLRRGPLSKRIT